MTHFPIAHLFWFVNRVVISCLCANFFCTALVASNQSIKSYNVPAGDASLTLEIFARQSGEQLVYLVDNVKGETTLAVRGELTAVAALEQMLQGTRLIVHHAGSDGAMTVSRRPETDTGGRSRATSNPPNSPRGS